MPRLASPRKWTLGAVVGASLLCGATCPESARTNPAATANRAKCGYQAGDLPTETLADYTTVGSSIPIDHIVLIMQENRSFDAYYSELTVPGQTVDGASPTATNPDPTKPGATISRFHQTAYCFPDTSHGWSSVHQELDGTKLDGFTAANAESDDPTGSRAMGYYDGSDLPFYYWLARTYTISDRHFCSVLGPTWPNREFYFAGTSFGAIGNDFPPTFAPDGNQYPNIFLELNAAKVSWKVYAEDLPTPAIFVQTYADNEQNFSTIDQFMADAMNGQLPAVSVVEGADSWGGASRDEHPPADMQVGEGLVASVYNALTSSPEWKSSVLFITYDEAGGQYDHVVPPPACAPDNLIDPTNGQPASFTQYGFRTPLLIVSPYARRGYVSHAVIDHTSITRFVEARFGLPAMSNRDANATPPFDMFDFDHPDFTVPAAPEAPIDPTQAASCATEFPRSTPSF